MTHSVRRALPFSTATGKLEQNERASLQLRHISPATNAARMWG